MKIAVLSLLLLLSLSSCGHKELVNVRLINSNGRLIREWRDVEIKSVTNMIVFKVGRDTTLAVPAKMGIISKRLP